VNYHEGKKFGALVPFFELVNLGLLLLDKVVDGLLANI